MAKSARVALVSGFWGQNIGNAFFNIGGKWILEKVFGVGNVAFIQDQPGYRTFHKQSRGNPRNAFDLIGHLDIDYLVLQGPLLTSTYRALWQKTFERLRRRKVKIILLGAAFFKYTQAELVAVRPFLEEFPPAVIVTRDSVTHKILTDWGFDAYDGIDSAFFVPLALPKLALDIEPYVTLTFDRWPEPTIAIGSHKQSKQAFLLDGEYWSISKPSIATKLADLGKAEAYLGHLMDRRVLPDRLGNYHVIRPEHRSNPHITWKIYKHPRSLVSDEPFSYAALYSSAALTMTDRVHAAILTLAYGNAAMLFTPTPRSSVFSRFGLRVIGEEPVRISADRLGEEQAGELRFVISRCG